MCRENPTWGAPRIHGELLNLDINVGESSVWTGQQLREAFPFDQLPRYLLHDHDAIFGTDFREQVRDLGIREVLSTPRSPWQRACVERVIGSIRRECLDHVIVFNETSLRRILASYSDYYHRSRNASFAGEGLAQATQDSATRNGISCSPATGRRTAPSLRTTGRLRRSPP
jgi:transposase InsO family protein